VQRRPSKFQLSSTASTRTPIQIEKHVSPTGAIAEDTPSRRVSSGGNSRDDSPPPESPKNRARISRRPSLPALNTPSGSVTSRKKSGGNLRGSYGFGSLSMATEQTCRQLRAYRKKLLSADGINTDILTQLDTELRLTAAALGERQIRNRSKGNQDGKAVSDLLDQYSERLVSMLDEKLRLRLTEEEKDALIRERPRTAGEGSSSSSSPGALCMEPETI
jgi:hypothetical protein